MSKIKQVYFTKTLNFFKKDFLKRWGLKEYNNPNEPSLFVGLYSKEDVNTFINHKSYKVLYFGGNDLQPPQLEIVSKSPKTFCIGYGGDWLYKTLDAYKILYTELRILLKDFSSFTPTPLGENIYVYKGLLGNRHDHYKWNDVVKPLQEVFGKDRIIYADNISLTELHEKYYNNSFVYLRPNPKGGGTAMFELGHMGRRTISNDHSRFSICSGYKDISSIIDLIMEESKKIGTIQPQIAEELKSMFDHEGNWLNLNNYKI
mgnify:CR=1 FL=1